MGIDDPCIMERGLLTERMTDEEIDSLNDAVELYLNGCEGEADTIISNEIGKKLWPSVRIYLMNLEKFYQEEQDEDE